jgi:hypothetical protein
MKGKQELNRMENKIKERDRERGSRLFTNNSPTKNKVIMKKNSVKM